MSAEILRDTDLAAAIQLGKAAGMTTREIVRELTRGMTHADALRLAKRAAPLLDVGVGEFIREISHAAGIADPESFRGNLQVAIPGQTLAARRKLHHVTRGKVCGYSV